MYSSSRRSAKQNTKNLIPLEGSSCSSLCRSHEVTVLVCRRLDLLIHSTPGGTRPLVSATLRRTSRNIEGVRWQWRKHIWADLLSFGIEGLPFLFSALRQRVLTLIAGAVSYNGRRSAFDRRSPRTARTGPDGPFSMARRAP